MTAQRTNDRLYSDAGGYPCSVIEAEKLFTALKRLHREVILAIYPGQGHVINDWNRSSAIDATERILEFFDSHLKR